MREGERSDLPEDLHDGDSGALAEDESSTEQGHHPPHSEDDSGDEQVQVNKTNDYITLHMKQTL